MFDEHDMLTEITPPETLSRPIWQMHFLLTLSIPTYDFEFPAFLGTYFYYFILNYVCL